MKQRIHNFLNNITKEHIFKFKFCGYKTAGDHPAVVTSTNIILINKNLFKKYTLIEQQCILLHEIGHIISNTQSEFIAHTTAIKLAKLNKLHCEYKLLKEIITNWSNIKDINYQNYKNAGNTYIYLNKMKNYTEC